MREKGSWYFPNIIIYDQFIRMQDDAIKIEYLHKKLCILAGKRESRKILKKIKKEAYQQIGNNTDYIIDELENRIKKINIGEN